MARSLPGNGQRKTQRTAAEGVLQKRTDEEGSTRRRTPKAKRKNRAVRSAENGALGDETGKATRRVTLTLMSWKLAAVKFGMIVTSSFSAQN